MAAVVVIWIGFLLDLILGDPPRLYHPVRWIGKEISFLEKRLLKRQKVSDAELQTGEQAKATTGQTGEQAEATAGQSGEQAEATARQTGEQAEATARQTGEQAEATAGQTGAAVDRTANLTECEETRKHRERRNGAVMAVIVMLTAFVVSALILWICYHVHPILGMAVEGWLCYRMLAAKCLRDESMPVYRALKKRDLSAARTAVSRIVGRDTDTLDEEGVAKATVETIAENASDGAVAPLFYMMLFGAVGGFVYKAVNTMDSMVGYKNDKYQYFGTVAARIDDVLNFIPSRICAVLIILCSWGRRFDRKRAANVWQRDRRKHKSPNSAQSEAAMAGALGIELAGDASYFGKIVKKDTIGDRTRAIEPEDIIRANRMLYRVVWVMMILFTVLKGALGFAL